MTCTTPSSPVPTCASAWRPIRECTVSAEKLDEIFDPWNFLTRIDVVFDRLERLSFAE